MIVPFHQRQAKRKCSSAQGRERRGCLLGAFYRRRNDGMQSEDTRDCLVAFGRIPRIFRGWRLDNHSDDFILPAHPSPGSPKDSR